MNNPRVAFFTDSLHEVNGVALTSREYVNFARKSQKHFFAVCAGAANRHWTDGTLETVELAPSPFVLGLERDLSFDVLFYRHRWFVERHLRNFRPDLVHITGPSHIGMLGAILAHRLKVPLVASWHTNIHEFGARRLEAKLGWLSEARRKAVTGWAQEQVLQWTLRFYKLARILFAPNPELVEMLSRSTGKPAFLMQRGIDTDMFSPARRRRGDSRFVIGFVGRLSPEKNVRLFARIEQSLRDSGVRDYRLLIVGDGSERSWLQQNLKQADLPGVLSGAPLAEAYASMDTFVFPSETDTFGNVVLEAMASGVPVVVSKEGGPKFLVQSRKNGYIADDYEGFVEALMDLRTHEHLRSRLSKGARATAMTFSWDNVFENVYARYRESLACPATMRARALRASVPLATAIRWPPSGSSNLSAPLADCGNTQRIPAP
jgi:phosphatidylinositol alpha 1,6-mannosyltransferase